MLIDQPYPSMDWQIHVHGLSIPRCRVSRYLDQTWKPHFQFVCSRACMGGFWWLVHSGVHVSSYRTTQCLPHFHLFPSHWIPHHACRCMSSLSSRPYSLVTNPCLFVKINFHIKTAIPWTLACGFIIGLDHVSIIHSTMPFYPCSRVGF